MTLAGCRVVVTGASSGLGAHVVRHLAGLGAFVVAAARREDRLAGLSAELADAPGRVMPHVADVTREEDARALVAAAVASFGGIDVLVNNAGSEVQGPLDVLSDEDFEAMFRANVVSVVRCTRAALPELRRSRGMVVNLGSTIASRPARGRFGYVAAKGAVEAMSRALALDLGRAPPDLLAPLLGSLRDTAMRDTDFAVLVTEPTPFGLHDLSLAVETARQLDIPFGVVINRAGLGDSRVNDFCAAESIPVLLEIPDDRRIAEACSRGEIFAAHDEAFADVLRGLAADVSARTGKMALR